MPVVALRTSSRFSHRDLRLGLPLIILLAFALRVIALDRLGLAYDESASALMARATPAEIIAFHWTAAFEHPPFWVLLLRVWSQMAGQSEFALRLLPAFAGTLSVVMIWRLIALIWPGDAVLPLLSALLVALAPVLVYYSQEARMYTLVVLLLLIATYLILRLRVQPTWRRVILFWLVCWATLGLHYYAGLALAIQAAVITLDGLIVGPIRRVPWLKLAIAYTGAILPLALWMLYSPGFHTTLDVVLDKAGENPVTWQYFLGDLWRELSFGSIRWQPPYAVWGYAVAPFVVVGGLLAIGQRRKPLPTRLGAWLVVALVLLPILSGAIALRTLVPRYILWVVPLFYSVAAVPAAWLWRRHWLAGALVVLVIIALDVLALQYYLGPYRKSDYRAMSEYLQSRGDAQGEILLLEAPRQHLLAKYYLPTWQSYPMPTLPLPAYWPVTAPLLVPEDEDDRLQAWFAEHAGVWVSYTSEAEVDKSEFLAKYLTAIAYREQCTQWLDVRLCHYVSPHHLSPRPFAIQPALFGNELALVAAQGSLYHPTPSSTSLLIELDWLAQQKPSIDYKLSLRLLNAEGATLDEANDYPIGPLLPPRTWNGEDRKPGYFVLRVPSDLPMGLYSVQLSFYDPNSLAPILATIMDNPASAATTQPVTLAELRVDDTMELQSPTAP